MHPNRSLDQGTFRTRRVSSEGLWACRGWRLKVYVITESGEAPQPSILVEAKRLAARRLPREPFADGRYGAGWIIVHIGEAGDYVFVDWWEHEDIVQHHLYGRPRGQDRFQYRWPAGAGFCVWEMAVCWHEREAWVRHVMDRSGDPDIEGYLTDQLEGRV